jgi:hypothetical protein
MMATSTKRLKIHKICQASLGLRVTSTGDGNISDVHGMTRDVVSIGT